MGLCSYDTPKSNDIREECRRMSQPQMKKIGKKTNGCLLNLPKVPKDLNEKMNKKKNPSKTCFFTKDRSQTCSDAHSYPVSALDGVVNMWQVQSKGSEASLLSSTDCVFQKQRRWLKDIAWHPEGNILFSVYSADGGDSQISVTNLNKVQGLWLLTHTLA